MRELLYPWMPANSYIKPYIFYRFSETIRNTLIWKVEKVTRVSGFEKLSKPQSKVIVPDTLVYNFDLKRNVYIIYNWYTHHYMIGNKHLIFILKLFSEAHTIPDAIDKLITYNPIIYILDDLKLLLPKLYQQRYLIDIIRKEQDHEHR